MIDFKNTYLNECIVHLVGNKNLEGKIKVTNAVKELDEGLERSLVEYFLRPFRASTEIYKFHHDVDLKMNVIFTCADKIFEGEDFVKNSQHIAKHLFQQTRHPAIKSGELFIAQFNDVVIENKFCKAVGIFKSERKDNFIQVDGEAKEIRLYLGEGINLQKLDKGCIIINDAFHEGFRVLTFEYGGADTDYWREDFLSIKPLENNYYQTKNFLNVCKEFVTDKLPAEFEISRVDQINILNKSVDYFKENDVFEEKNFLQNVLADNGLIKSFKKFKDEYQEGGNFIIEDTFEISSPAVKKQAKHFKSVLKLDKNFHVYIHGNQDLIEQGYDAKKGMNFYKIYYSEEL
ncbi:MAG: hypothetical protein POELPBGB_02932 [Bacteroidia bacterium]|nr:hypothetical protein [Bacteroidia bacterium]